MFTRNWCTGAVFVFVFVIVPWLVCARVEEACVGREDKGRKNRGRVWGQLPESLWSKSGGSNLDLRGGLQVRKQFTKNIKVRTFLS